jgi:hypothetical protein
MDEEIKKFSDLVYRLRYKAMWDESGDLEEAADAIEERSKPRWIPVTERLPEVNKYVLGCFKDGSMTAVCLFNIDEHITFWRACTDEGWEADCDSEPTHWMPLPTPPKEEAT